MLTSRFGRGDSAPMMLLNWSSRPTLPTRRCTATLTRRRWTIRSSTHRPAGCSSSLTSKVDPPLAAAIERYPATCPGERPRSNECTSVPRHGAPALGALSLQGWKTKPAGMGTTASSWMLVASNTRLTLCTRRWVTTAYPASPSTGIAQEIAPTPRIYRSRSTDPKELSRCPRQLAR